MKTTEFYEQVTNKIAEQLESVNVSDYRKPWFNLGNIPFNAFSGKAYRGINHLILSLNDYATPAYGTFKQWQEKGCLVNKGEKGHHVSFWNFDKKQKENMETGELELVSSVFMKTYVVFNVHQVSGDFAEKVKTKQAKPLNTLESFDNAESCIAEYVKQSGIALIQPYDRACYIPALDSVKMPVLGQFTDSESYYSVFFHELTHSTGHESRLKRDLANGFGSQGYAREELVAELGAAMLCAALGISQAPRQDHAIYIKSWLKALKDDKKFIFSAASQAQKATDWILKAGGIAEKESEDESAIAA